mmetsp:Transcript_14890/g.25363  ORF Transcript_14890/g.25363 Transcript_14890/m.25363 type:complete len:791 (+) Transcript_14890:874-3246(+)
MAGQGKALVCCVGENTLLGRNRKPKDLVIDEQHTFLEEKLEKIAKQIRKYAILVTMISIVTRVIFLVGRIMFSGDQDLFSNNTLLEIGKIAIVAVVIMIVAIPEGLPLAVSIAMALSINNLKKDEILVKNLESVQNLAMVHDVCVGKTGTLTRGKLNVKKYQIGGDFEVYEHNREGERDFFSTKLSIQQELKDVLKEAVFSNTDVRIETNDAECKYEPKGQALEVGMIQFLMDNEEDVQSLFIARNKSAPKIVQLPFDQEKKRKVVVRRVPDNEELVRIYVKGAPEFVLPLCSQTLSPQVQPVELSEDEVVGLLSEIVTAKMASEGLKVLSYAFKEIRLEDLDQLMQSYNTEGAEFREQLEADLIYLGTFAMEDQIRSNVKESIKLIKYGSTEAQGKNQVNVRIITGDHIETAKATAIELGIITHEEANLNGYAITGEQFREALGPYTKITDKVSGEVQVQFAEKKRFDEFKQKLRIIARCTSEDKFLLVSCIKQRGGLVCMTGDSIADAEALRKANVGLCMGSGCDVAKDNSDLVILDNDFVSIHRGIKWGRAIFDNVRKFLQFQLTINIVLCFVTLLSGFTLGRTPLNVIQMLWVNLIMDVLGAVAIGTEPYKNDTAGASKSNRISRQDKIVLPEMWRQVLVQAAYQVLVMVFLMYFGELIFFETSFNLISEPNRDANNLPTSRLVLDTLLFHTFILMNLFNQVNCRVVEAEEINVFKTLFNNPFFWAVFILELSVQQLMINVGGTSLGSALLGTAPLTQGMVITAWCLGAFTLVVNVGLKQIPMQHF